jgi:hypothetical protein
MMPLNLAEYFENTLVNILEISCPVRMFVITLSGVPTPKVLFSETPPSTWEWRSPGLSAETLCFTRRGSIEPPSRKFFCEDETEKSFLPILFALRVSHKTRQRTARKGATNSSGSEGGRQSTSSKREKFISCSSGSRSVAPPVEQRHFVRLLKAEVRSDLMTPVSEFTVKFPEEGLNRSPQDRHIAQTGGPGSSLSWQRREESFE